VVRATAADQEVKSTKSTFLFSPDAAPASAPAMSLPAAPGSTLDEAPTMRLVNPSTDGKVQGVVTLRVEAHDSSGKAPYVSLFVDKTFKTLRNFAPYEFEWDTTAYSNGPHTIEVYGYNDSPHVGHAQAIQLIVNNPGGETQIRHDLLDGVKSVKPLKIVRPLKALRSAQAIRATAPQKALGRPLPLRRPDVFSAGEAAPQMAAIHPMRPAGTQEIIRQLTRGAGSLHFGSLGFATDLSTPFVAPQAAPVPSMAGPHTSSRMLTVPQRGFKALPGALPTLRPATEAARRVDPADAALAETPAHQIAEKIARAPRLPGQRLMALHLPTDSLASPFLAAPRVRAHTAAPRVNVLASKTQMRVHLPTSLGSLLRSVGQKTLMYNHTVVRMDRPLSAQEGIVFGPLRQVFEQSGGTLTWQASTRTVHAKNATRDITLTIGKSTALVNDKNVTLDGTPYLLTGRTMVPLSFVGAAMDADVQYDAATGHLLVTSRK
ncbi:MAG: stalk domain-containing protein, partial [Armatimonadota bacterium]|nr:stalk domain-containing protein [Armatimonadota bacterium]